MCMDFLTDFFFLLVSVGGKSSKRLYDNPQICPRDGRFGM